MARKTKKNAPKRKGKGPGRKQVKGKQTKINEGDEANDVVEIKEITMDPRDRGTKTDHKKKNPKMKNVRRNEKDDDSEESVQAELTESNPKRPARRAAIQASKNISSMKDVKEDQNLDKKKEVDDDTSTTCSDITNEGLDDDDDQNHPKLVEESIATKVVDGDPKSTTLEDDECTKSTTDTKKVVMTGRKRGRPTKKDMGKSTKKAKSTTTTKTKKKASKNTKNQSTIAIVTSGSLNPL